MSFFHSQLIFFYGLIFALITMTSRATQLGLVTSRMIMIAHLRVRVSSFKLDYLVVSHNNCVTTSVKFFFLIILPVPMHTKRGRAEKEQSS